jgi:non-specific serine/threonine protein kinase/serine/threonine-protein kinase
MPGRDAVRTRRAAGGLTVARDETSLGAVTATAWDEVKRLFGEALEQSPPTRAAWLDTACAGRTWVRREVESLLDAHERAGAFFDTRAHDTRPRVTPADDDDLAGRQLGPYRVEERLGRGGMGTVYRARRSSPEREVALKVVSVENAGDEARRRFQAETEILARFDHPYIARFYDADTTPEGRPYFVMELVRGQALDEACRDGRPGLRARLQLFLEVCEAVSYAHARLVVHRDLKPGNILIAPDGHPKLLDFGIARLLAGGPSSPHALTETGLRLMTPEFASPEQVRGEPATVATDVHGLGLLLGLLLTGRSPLRLRSSAPAELVRAVCVDEPLSPSASIGLPRAEGVPGFEPPESPRSLARLLSGDLDAIVSKALRKEPERRYASVEQLAADVRRYLEGRPVEARGGRWRYRLGKFARRQRLPLGLAAALVLAVATGWATTARQARVAREERARAERRFADVRQLASRFLFEFHDTVADLPGSTAAREMVVRTAAEYLDSLTREAGGDAELAMELARAYRRLGRAQGIPGSGMLGDTAAALRSLRQARQVLDQVDPARRGVPGYRAARIDVSVDLARALEQAGTYAEYHAALDEAAREARELRAETRELGDYESVARAYYDWSYGLERRGRLTQAAAAALESLAVSEEIRERWPQNANHSRRLGPSLHRLASLELRLGRVAEARRHAQAAVDLRRAAYRPDNALAARGLVAALPVLASALASAGDLEAAETVYAEALQVAGRLAADDPRDRQARNDMAALAGEWCGAYNRAGRRVRHDVCRRALRVFETDARQPDELTQYNLAATRMMTAREIELSGDPGGALGLYERAFAAASGPVLAEGGDPTTRLLAEIECGQARAHLALGQARAAQPRARSAARRLEPGARGAEDTETLEMHVTAHMLLARIEASLAGDPGAGCAALRPAAASVRALGPRATEQPVLRALLLEHQALASGCP